MTFRGFSQCLNCKEAYRRVVYSVDFGLSSLQ